MVLDAVSIVLSIFALIGVGMLLARMGWLQPDGARLIARLTVNVAMAGLVVSNMLTQFTRDKLVESLSGIGLSYASMLLTIVLGMLVARLLRIEKNRRGAFTCMFGFSNAVFIGLPVAVALFGEQVTPYALIYYIANTSLFWSLGNLMLSRDGGKKGALDVKKLFPVPLIAFLACVVLLIFGIRLPEFVMSASKYLGNMVTPMSLIYTGYIILRMISNHRVRWQKGYVAMLTGRFVLAPLLLVGCAMIFPVPPLMKSALLVQSAMPVMTQSVILAGDRGADTEYIAGGIALSTALSLAVLPVLMALMPYLP